MAQFRYGERPGFFRSDFTLGVHIFSYIECRTPFGSPNMRTERFPKVGSQRVDRCINRHPDFGFFNRCTEAAQRLVADAYCRRVGSGEAVSWGTGLHAGIHSIYDEQMRGFGNQPGADALKELTCRQLVRRPFRIVR